MQSHSYEVLVQTNSSIVTGAKQWLLGSGSWGRALGGPRGVQKAVHC